MNLEVDDRIRGMGQPYDLGQDRTISFQRHPVLYNLTQRQRQRYATDLQVEAPPSSWHPSHQHLQHPTSLTGLL